MAQSAAECAEMVAACREAGVRLSVVSQHRFRDAPVAAKRLIDEGAIGDVRMIQVTGAEVGWWDLAARGDEWKLDPHQQTAWASWGAHSCDLLRWFSGGDGELAFARITNFSGEPPDVGQSAAVTFEMTTGALAHILMSYEFPPPGIQPAWTWRIVGSTGIIELDPYRSRPARAGRRLAASSPSRRRSTRWTPRTRSACAPTPASSRTWSRRSPTATTRWSRARKAATPRRCSTPPSDRPPAGRPRRSPDTERRPIGMTIDRAASAWTPHPGGPLRYRADSRFGADGLPPGAWFGRVSAALEAPDGSVVVFHRGPAIEPIVFLDRDGRYLRSWDLDFDLPHGMRLMPDGNLWLTDAGRHRVLKTTLDGEILLELGTAGVAGTDEKTFDRPTDVAVAADGTIYVSDGYGNCRIVVFDPDGTYRGTWGVPGTAPGEFDTPHSVAVAPGRLDLGQRPRQPADPALRAGRPLHRRLDPPGRDPVHRVLSAMSCG